MEVEFNVLSFLSEFKSTDAFVGYHKDVPATVVFEACRFLPETRVIKQRKETTDDEVSYHKSIQLLL